MDFLLIALIILGVVVVGVGAVAISVRRQGRLGMWLGTKLLSNQKVQAVAMKRIEQQLEQNPQQFEEIAAQNGVSKEQAATALQAYQRMNPQQQRQILARAQKMSGEDTSSLSEEDLAEIAGVSAGGVAPRSGTSTKQRQRNRTRSKSAKQARKRNR